MVTQSRVSRKQQFRAALSLAGMTAQEWAAAQEVTVTHLNFVLAGERESPRLVEAVDRFIEQQAPKMAAEVAA